jgi:hypothetical protein
MTRAEEQHLSDRQALDIAQGDYVAACEAKDWAAAAKARKSMFFYAARIEWFGNNPGVPAETLH